MCFIEYYIVYSGQSILHLLDSVSLPGYQQYILAT